MMSIEEITTDKVNICMIQIDVTVAELAGVNIHNENDIRLCSNK